MQHAGVFGPQFRLVVPLLSTSQLLASMVIGASKCRSEPLESSGPSPVGAALASVAAGDKMRNDTNITTTALATTCIHVRKLKPD